MPEKIVLAYSGGLDTSVALRWLADEYRAEVIALLVDVGQPIDIEAVRMRAAQAGAGDVVVIDARREFAERYCLPTLQAGALYEGQYPLVSALSRPLIAEKMVEVARQTGADAVAHGCTGKGNDQVRFEAAVAALAPDLAVLAPVRDWGMTREQEIAYADRHGIEVPVKSGAAYSIDANLWGRSIECGPLEDPWVAPPEAPFLLTADPTTAPEAPQEVVIAFEQGVPVAIDGDELPLDELILKASEIAGAHGVGRIDVIENRLVGIKSREVYEAPAAALLYAAHGALESLTVERDLQHLKAELAHRYAGARLQRPLVLADEGRARRVRRDGAAGRHRRGARAAVQGPRAGRRTARARLAVRPRSRDVRGGRRLPARRRGGLHPHLEPPDEDVGGHAADHEAARVVEPESGTLPAGGPLWSGRLAGGLDPVLLGFSRSLPVDRALFAHDVRASIAHVRMLGRQGLIEQADADALASALAGLEPPPDDAPDEDIHSYLERRLVEELGPLGRRVHAGRSRNDQVAVATRLWAKDACRRLVGLVGELQQAFVDAARAAPALVLPGYTHLQRAQPVLLGHYLAAHAWALARDDERFRRAYAAADVSSLGAGALAGSSLPLDPAWTAAELGFAEAFSNSIDAVSDRDFVCDLLYACTMAFVHLSRLGEEVVIYTSQEFGLAELDDRVALGSSIMPQKKNPQIAEHLRGRAGIAIGRLTGFLAVVKGLPLAYDSDLQEDKEVLFAQVAALEGALEAAALLVGGRAARARPALRRRPRGSGGGRRLERRHRCRRGARARRHALPRGPRARRRPRRRGRAVPRSDARAGGRRALAAGRHLARAGRRAARGARPADRRGPRLRDRPRA